MSKKSNQVSATLKAWAESLSIDPSTIKRKLARQEIKFEPGVPLTAMEIFRALNAESEKDQAITERTREETRAKKRENDIAEKRLHDLDEVERLVWQDLLLPLRHELEQMPAAMCGLCNPQEPESAKKILEQWVEKVKSNIREKNP
jgi:hypothetical protein